MLAFVRVYAYKQVCISQKSKDLNDKLSFSQTWFVIIEVIQSWPGYSASTECLTLIQYSLGGGVRHPHLSSGSIPFAHEPLFRPQRNFHIGWSPTGMAVEQLS